MILVISMHLSLFAPVCLSEVGRVLHVRLCIEGVRLTQCVTSETASGRKNHKTVSYQSSTEISPMTQFKPPSVIHTQQAHIMRKNTLTLGHFLTHHVHLPFNMCTLTFLSLAAWAINNSHSGDCSPASTSCWLTGINRTLHTHTHRSLSRQNLSWMGPRYLLIISKQGVLFQGVSSFLHRTDLSGGHHKAIAQIRFIRSVKGDHG